MVRLTLAFWLGLVTALGFGMFQVKYEVQAIEEELVRVNHRILADHQSIHVLKAEWSYLTRPERMETMARRHLGLAPTAREQFAEIATIPWRPGSEPPPPIAAAPPGPRSPAARPASRRGDGPPDRAVARPVALQPAISTTTRATTLSAPTAILPPAAPARRAVEAARRPPAPRETAMPAIIPAPLPVTPVSGITRIRVGSTGPAR